MKTPAHTRYITTISPQRNHINTTKHNYSRIRSSRNFHEDGPLQKGGGFRPVPA